MDIVIKQELIDYLNDTLEKQERVVRAKDGCGWRMQQEWAYEDVINAIGKFESKYKNVLEFKVPSNGALTQMVDALHANGYSIQTAIVWEEPPKNGVKYFAIRAEEPTLKGE